MKNAASLGIGFGLTAALVLATAALAQGPDQTGPDRRGQRADADQDGRVTLQESQAALRGRLMRFDANRDGKVSQAEIDTARTAQSERRTERRTQRGEGAFARLDADHSGQISQQEFDAGRERMREHRDERRGQMGRHGGRPGGRHGERGDPAERFARLDADKDGSVSSAEMDRAAAEHFQRMDANRDGAVTADERPARGRRGE